MVALLICGMLMLSLMDTTVCPGFPCWCRLLCWCHLSCLLMPSLLVSPHWCHRSWSPHLCCLSWSLLVDAVSQVLVFPWTMMVTGDSLVNILPIKIQYFFLYSVSSYIAARASSLIQDTRECYATTHATHVKLMLEREICKCVSHEQTLVTHMGHLPFRTSVL